VVGEAAMMPYGPPSEGNIERLSGLGRMMAVPTAYGGPSCVKVERGERWLSRLVTTAAEERLSSAAR
jgi:hypothetical protein